MVDGACPSRDAIERIEGPATTEREISSRSASVNASLERCRCAGWERFTSAPALPH